MKFIVNFFKVVAWIWAIFIIFLCITENASGGPDLIALNVFFAILILPSVIFLTVRYKMEKNIREQRKIQNQENQEKRLKKQQEPEIKDGKMIFSFKGILGDSPCIVTIDGNWLAIKREGTFNALKHGFDGIKKINIKNITAVQFKEGGLSSGYIQFALLGSQEAKGGVSEAHYDENSVVFGPDYNEMARKLVNILEGKIDMLQNGSNINPQVFHNESVAKQLKDFKELLDNGIITKEEFEIQKQKLLSSN